MQTAQRSLNKITSQLAEWWKFLGDPGAISWAVIWPFVVAAIWVTLVFDMPAQRAVASENQFWFAAGLLSAFAALVWLVTIKELWPHVPVPTRRIVLLVSFALAGLIRNLTLTFLCKAFNLVAPSSRVWSSMAAAIVLLTFLSLTSVRVSENKEVLKSLRAERRKLLWLSATFDEKVAQANRNLHLQIDEELLPAVRRVLIQLDGSETAKAKSISENIIQTVTRVVRPLTDRLGARSEDLLEQLDFVSAKVDEPTDLDRKFDIRQILRPSWPLLVLLLVAAGTSPIASQGPNFLGFLTACTLAWFFTVVVRRLWPSRFVQLSETSATLVAVTVPAFAFGATGLVLVKAGFGLSAVTAQVSFAIGGSFILARIRIAGQSAKLMKLQLQNQIETLEQLISQLRKQIWITRRKAAWVLHGPIQSALISSALSLAHPTSASISKAEIRERIEAALAELVSDSGANQDLEATLAEISTVWQRSARTKWSISADALAMLTLDPDSVSCLAEICREGVSNAVRHGRATEIEMAIELQAANQFRIRITDNGRGLGLSDSAEHQVGFGSAMLDQISLRWRRFEEHGETVLEAIVLSDVTLA